MVGEGGAAGGVQEALGKTLVVSTCRSEGAQEKQFVAERSG